jgi:hypothetical protein
MLDQSIKQDKEHADLCHIRSPGYIAAWTILHVEKNFLYLKEISFIYHVISLALS